MNCTIFSDGRAIAQAVSFRLTAKEEQVRSQVKGHDEWTQFQTPYISEKLVVPRVEPGPLTTRPQRPTVRTNAMVKSQINHKIDTSKHSTVF
jgi:hypothetical protein